MNIVLIYLDFIKREKVGFLMGECNWDGGF